MNGGNGMNVWRESAQNLRKLRPLVTTALFVALYVVLGMFSVQVTVSLKLSFTFMAVACVAMLYGPVPAMLAGALGDFLTAMLFPTGAYFFGFTLSAALGGLIYSLFLYRTEINVWRCALAKLGVNLLVNVLLNTYWLTFITGNTFAYYFVTRLTKNLLLLPIEAAVLLLVGLAVRRIRPRLPVAPR